VFDLTISTLVSWSKRWIFYEFFLSFLYYDYDFKVKALWIFVLSTCFQFVSLFLFPIVISSLYVHFFFLKLISSLYSCALVQEALHVQNKRMELGFSSFWLCCPTMVSLNIRFDAHLYDCVIDLKTNNKFNYFFKRYNTII